MKPTSLRINISIPITYSLESVYDNLQRSWIVKFGIKCHIVFINFHKVYITRTVYHYTNINLNANGTFSFSCKKEKCEYYHRRISIPLLLKRKKHDECTEAIGRPTMLVILDNPFHILVGLQNEEKAARISQNTTVCRKKLIIVVIFANNSKIHSTKKW